MHSKTPWHSEKIDAGKRHQLITTLIKSQQLKQATRYLTMRRYASVYEYGWKAAEYLSTRGKFTDDSILTFNAAQNAVDTLVSQVCTPKIAPLALTKGGSWEQRERAEELTQALQGEFSECEVDEQFEDVCLDFEIFGAGFLKVLPDYRCEKIVAERMNPLDMVFDDQETRYRKPRCAYHSYVMDRYEALAEFGEPDDDLVGSAQARREAILRAPAAQADDDVADGDHVIRVYESWALPTYVEDGKCDGRYSICIEGTDLYDQPWKWRRFPFQSYIPRKSRIGIWGIPGMRQLASGQREFEVTTAKMQRAFKRAGGFHLLIPRSANMQKRQITNDSGDQWEYDGPNPPRELVMQTVSQQQFQYNQMLPDQMLRFLGVSGFSAQSEVPRGIGQASGKALQVFSGAEDKRLILRHKARERFVLGVSELIMLSARDLVEHCPDYEVRHQEKSAFKSIRWKDLLESFEDEKNYVLKVFPVGGLSQEPASRFEQLTEMANAGRITNEQYLEMIDVPDLEADNEINLSDIRVIKRNLEYMIRTGTYLPVEPFDKHQLILEYGSKYYNAARIAEVPESRLALLRQYVADAQSEIQRVAPPPQPAPPMDAPPANDMQQPPPDMVAA